MSGLMTLAVFVLPFDDFHGRQCQAVQGLCRHVFRMSPAGLLRMPAENGVPSRSNGLYVVFITVHDCTMYRIT